MHGSWQIEHWSASTFIWELCPNTVPWVMASPNGADDIDLRYSADALKAVSDLQLGSCPRAILKIRPPSSLDYRARHGPNRGVFAPRFISLH